MDMTSFIKTNGNKSKVNFNENTSNTNFNYSTNEEVKKKAASLDSINAVERELDEVLKDLELNSQDLNDQLNENEYMSHNNMVELPISIQKNTNFRLKPHLSHKSEFINSSQTDLYMDEGGAYSDKETLKSQKFQIKVTNEELIKKQMLTNGKNLIRKRQNIVSTYEICQDCFDSAGESAGSGASCQHHSSTKSANMNCSDFANYSPNTKNQLNKPTPQQAMKYGTSYSSQDIRTRNVLSQISESVVPEPKPVSILRNMNKTPQSNGHVTSQKVITIGIPQSTSQKAGCDQSPSPNSRSKSIPISKLSNSSGNSIMLQVKSCVKEEDKLDRLPPVPPSAWSGRRNQGAYASNNRLRRQNSKTPTNESNAQSNENNNNGHSTRQSNGVSELTIQESNSATSSYEEAEPNSFSKQLNYDNFNLVEAKSDEPEEKIEVTISRDARYKDFGFSISDNFFGSGILINKIRTGSPAEQNSHLKPFTQIFKVIFVQMIVIF